MINRNRILLALLIILTILSGLGSRKFSMFLPQFISEYAGDTLWALMVYFIFSFIFPRVSIIKIAWLSMIFSFFIEFSQLYSAEWIDSLRRNALAALVLGKGFLWADLVCYTIGIFLGMVIDLILNHPPARRSNEKSSF